MKLLKLTNEQYELMLKHYQTLSCDNCLLTNILNDGKPCGVEMGGRSCKEAIKVCFEDHSEEVLRRSEVIRKHPIYGDKLCYFCKYYDNNWCNNKDIEVNTHTICCNKWEYDPESKDTNEDVSFRDALDCNHN